ncbi:restriction endonuclease subunit S [Chryseobacterium luteum]|uniref:restriction endonuclease subunit S n=1 Tax=Chryseobacterium luteum TaxID=421531 RepID=UPI00068A601F|nr:restriction endonuclease subunit S [Chryseobacterium luteum]
MSNWKTYKLGEIAKIIGGGTPSTSKEEYWNGEIGWLTPRDLTGYSYKYISKGERNITAIGLKNSSARLMKEGTVLMTSRAPIGYLAIAGNELCTNQGFKSFIVNEDKINNEYLYYLLKNNISRIKSLGTGSTFAEVSASILKELEIQAPELTTQNQIAEILSSLDDKLELLQQMNQTLENIAQEIFENMLVTKNKKGWEEIRLGDIIEIKGGFSYKSQFIGSGDSLLLGMGCVSFNERFLFSGARPYSGEFNNNYLAKSGDIVIATRQQSDNLPILGFPAKVPKSLDNKKVIVGTNLYKVNNHSNFHNTFLFQLFRSNDYRKHILANSKGSTVRMITKDSVENYLFKIPPKEVFRDIEAVLNAIDYRIEDNTFQIQTLTQTRDTLLPKLMSGQLEIKN